MMELAWDLEASLLTCVMMELAVLVIAEMACEGRPAEDVTSD